jgi:RNA polymerase sigma factor (sigma-70 family)
MDIDNVDRLVCMGDQTVTSASLLRRVRDTGDREAWGLFDSTYRDLLVRFCVSLGIQHADTDDVVQAVFAKLIASIDEFEYDRAKGRFRDYLFRCVRNTLSDRAALRRRSTTANLTEVWAGDTAAQRFEREWVAHHFRLALAKIRPELDTRTEGLLDGMLAGRPAVALAAAAGMTDQAVYKAQQRLRDRLKHLVSEQVAQEDGRLSSESVRLTAQDGIP